MNKVETLEAHILKSVTKTEALEVLWKQSVTKFDTIEGQIQNLMKKVDTLEEQSKKLMSKADIIKEVELIKGDPKKAKSLAELSEKNEAITNAFNELVLVLSKKGSSCQSPLLVNHSSAL